LGVHFDRKLSFKIHVTIQTSKALNVAHALRYLGNTARGIPPRLARQAIIACVLPIAHFAAESWWPGKKRIKGSKLISNKFGVHSKALEKVYTTAARAILPQIDPIFHPPWEVEETLHNKISNPVASTRTPQIRTGNLQNIFNSLPKNAIIICCDGAFPLGNRKEIEDAEAFAALQGIKAAIALPKARFSKDLWVFTDNQGVAKKLLTKSLTLTSQPVYLTFVENWCQKQHFPETAIS
ncbi:hypothetical protein EPUL_005806, partial [Erysiphe pulchra]